MAARLPRFFIFPFSPPPPPYTAAATSLTSFINVSGQPKSRKREQKLFPAKSYMPLRYRISGRFSWLFLFVGVGISLDFWWSLTLCGGSPSVEAPDFRRGERSENWGERKQNGGERKQNGVSVAKRKNGNFIFLWVEAPELQSGVCEANE